MQLGRPNEDDARRAGGPVAKSRAVRNWPPLKSLFPILARVFRVDLRSLALLRMGLGILVLAAVAERGQQGFLFQRDDGPWPAAAALADHVPAGQWSLHFLTGTLAGQAAFAGLEAAAGFALLLGWRTRSANVVAWLLTISVQSRNPLVLGGGSAVFRMLLFWALWLPLGERWSLDARRRQALQAPTVLSAASAALLLQIAAIYIFNALHKSGAAWHSRGDAIAMAMHCETYAGSAGRALLAWPGLLTPLTHTVYWLEALGPLLIFVPWGKARLRAASVALFLAFHAGLAVTMNLGAFPYVCMVAWLSILPFEFWERWRPVEPSSRRSPAWSDALAAAAFAYVLCWNLRAWFPAILPEPLPAVGQALRIDQRWGMFAPEPWKIEGWVVVVGTDREGRETNLLTGQSPVIWKRPEKLGEVFSSADWRKFTMNVVHAGRSERARWYAQWLAREWQRVHPEAPPFVRLEVYYLSYPIYDHRGVPDNYLVWDDPPSEPEKPAMSPTESPQL
jgi:hypothetical protein